MVEFNLIMQRPREDDDARPTKISKHNTHFDRVLETLKYERFNIHGTIKKALEDDLRDGVKPYLLIVAAIQWSADISDESEYTLIRDDVAEDIFRSAFAEAIASVMTFSMWDMFVWFLQAWSMFNPEHLKGVRDAWIFGMVNVLRIVAPKTDEEVDFLTKLCDLGLLEPFCDLKSIQFVAYCGRVDVLKLRIDVRKTIKKILLNAPNAPQSFEYLRKHAVIRNITSKKMRFDQFVDQFADVVNVKNRSKYTDMDIFTYSNKYINSLFDHFK